MTGRQRAAHGRSVTLADVAERVGVSARTVSRVVNDEGGYTPQTRDRILTAIDELGYRPNLMARGLIRRRSDTIGFVTIEMLDPFFPEVADSVQRAAGRLGRTMFLASTHNDPEAQALALRSFQGHGVDGVIVFPARDSVDDLAMFARMGLPIVVVNSPVEAPGLASVSADIGHGAELAVEHLVDSGRRRIALLIDHKAHSDVEPPSRRKLGYLTSIVRAGLTRDEKLIVPVANSFEGGRQGVRHLLGNGVEVDAIFAYNDVIAVGAQQEALTRGIRVPDDLAVVGFDDIALCDAVVPRLSTIRIDRDLLGRLAVEALRDLLNGDEVSARSLPVELIHRDSS